MTLSEALDPLAIGTRLQSTGIWTATVASGDKHEIILSYLSHARSKEEIKMLENETRNIVFYYEKIKMAVLREIECRSSNFDPLSRGITVLLHNLLAKINHYLEQGYVTERVMTTSTEPPDGLEDQDSDDEFSSDTSSDEL